MWLGLLYAWFFALFCSNQKWRLSFLKQPEQHPIEWQARIWFYSSPSDLDEMLPYESQISCSHTIYCLTGDRRRPHLEIGNSQSTVLWMNFYLKCRFWQVRCFVYTNWKDECWKIVVNLQGLGHPNLGSNTKQKSFNSYNFWHENVSFKLGKNRQTVMLLTKREFFLSKQAEMN